jgi:hypothetical protein
MYYKERAGETLMAFEERLQHEAQQKYRVACQIWAPLTATGAAKSKRPPEPPAILKD